MRKVKRFGVSLEEDLLKKLDELVSRHAFPNRSQAIRSLIQKDAVSRSWQENKEVAGCVVLVYDHHKRDLLTRSIDIQHSYQELVLSVQHVHLDHHNCLEIIALKGTQVAYIVASFGALGAMLSFVLDQPPLVMFTLLIVSGLVAQIVGDVYRLFRYSRGA